tara:strand:- start:725 stop:1162 length:438 start_codon:yes stop_codon:yes gene_type:complete
MIQSFKIHTNYIIEGGSIKVSWKTKGAFFIKFHTGSLTKGWYKNNDEILLNIDKSLDKITLYAFGFDGIEKEVIKININKFRTVNYSKSRIKPLIFFLKKTFLSTKINFAPKEEIIKVNIGLIKIKKQNLTIKDITNNLKVEENG